MTTSTVVSERASAVVSAGVGAAVEPDVRVGLSRHAGDEARTARTVRARQARFNDDSEGDPGRIGEDAT